MSAARVGTGRPRGFVAGWRPQARTRLVLEQVAQVLDEYRQYLPLTCRQIFYRLVGAHGYDKTELAYKRLCETLVVARRAQVLEFADIRDDDAPLPRSVGFEDPAEFVEVVRDQAGRLHLDRQARTRPFAYVVLMCEARGIVPQLERVARGFSVPVLGSGGFDSLTFKFTFARWVASLGRSVEVLHIGDHDPSGVHIYGNLVEDVGSFAAHLCGEVGFSRLAVTPAQATELRLPTAPRKTTDRRRFDGIGGDSSATVQAEAMPPDVIAEILRRALRLRIPDYVLTEVETDEALARRRLMAGFTRLLPGPNSGGARP